MYTVGYEQSNGYVDYVLLYDDNLENIMTTVIYENKDIRPRMDGETSKTTKTKQEYFSKEVKDDEDTRFRFLKQNNGVWIVRDYYGKPYHDITFSNVVMGGKRRQTRRVPSRNSA